METFKKVGSCKIFMPDDKLARALGSRIRRDLLQNLLGKELSVHELADALGLSGVNASKHLKKLYDLGLLNSKLDGRERFYSIKILEIDGLLREYDVVVHKMGDGG